MTPEQIAFSEYPILAVVAVVAVAVFSAGLYVMREQQKSNKEIAQEWQYFIAVQNAECREWSKEQAEITKAWQLEMAQTIEHVASRVDKMGERVERRLDAVESATSQMAASFEAVAQLLNKNRVQTAPLKPPDDRKRL